VIFRNVQFLQLVNHGVDAGLLQQIKADITEFFRLPLQEKAVAIPPNGLQGFGHHFFFPKEQKLDWADLLFLVTRPVEERSNGFLAYKAFHIQKYAHSPWMLV
jgi:isopenicillin N synthase-like dioxygenase